ncbi:GGDEF domain-containing protein [Deinococcus cavernae]|uniref:GGDEF domain-containing protein n=1 Tax=Deinococcus cavernae TaxID=2320857 RepID=A0A418V9Q2_9DEIO|nr:diguanylate cyclase [Deinococcus cavernae]RJF72776.1 GGDEF domain-containing protein [Deinococcus cavernae]
MVKVIVLNLSLLIALMYGLSLTYVHPRQFLRQQKLDAHWLLLSLAPILLMNFPITLSEGVFIDLRAVPVVLMALRFSPEWLVAGLLPAIMYRVALGGPGVMTGTISLIGVALVGQWLRQQPEVRQQALTYQVPLRKVLLALVPNALLLPLHSQDLTLYLTVYLPLLALCALAYVIAAMMLHNRYRLLHLFRLYEEQAHQDVLSTLPNRRQFDLDLHQLAPDDVLCLIDIDHFKVVNDRYGHQVGDEVLKGVAEAIASCLRRHDRAYRHGGEEFAAIFRNAAQADPWTLGERIRKKVGALHFSELGGAGVTVSVGIARANFESPDACFQQVDQNMYAAKQRGRNCTVASQALTPSAPPALSPEPEPYDRSSVPVSQE